MLKRKLLFAKSKTLCQYYSFIVTCIQTNVKLYKKSLLCGQVLFLRFSNYMLVSFINGLYINHKYVCISVIRTTIYTLNILIVGNWFVLYKLQQEWNRNDYHLIQIKNLNTFTNVANHIHIFRNLYSLSHLKYFYDSKIVCGCSY